MSQKKIEKLIDIGKKHNCEFYLPPFYKGSTNPFFDITNIVGKQSKMVVFMGEIARQIKTHKNVKVEDRTYIELWL